MSDKKSKIDYSKFKCEIYNPDGKYLKDAMFNSEHNFYCPGLTPGQKYFVVFSYDEIFLQSFSFNCVTNSKIVYLSPAHIVFNHSVESLPGVLESSLKAKIKKYLALNLPKTRWAKHALDAFIDSTHEGKKKMYCSNQIFSFKVGNDISANLN